MPKISYWNIMTRRKPMPSPTDNEETKLGRVFSTFDLTALGVSATLGVGVYVLAGHVAKLEAGPSVILSFAIAAFASFLAGLCYAEFASRVPKSGSAYIFTYVAIGEFVAFIIGWNLLLEYIIGSASIAKGLSLYIDSLAGDAMKNHFKMIAPLNLSSFISSYFDFFAFGCPLLLGLLLAFGLRKSAGMNNILCMLNLGVVLYVVVTVIMNANLDYWRIDPSVVPEEHRNATGAGGFFPFGFSGTIKGAATCFFGFVGFDCIATTGEEVRNPRKAVPRAILFSLVIIFLAYFGVSLLTLMWPYYLLDVDAPLPHAFQEIGWITSKWIVTIGGIVGLIASLFGAMFPLPRILYAMSIDGLIFREFGIISERFQTPVIGTLCAAALTSCFAGLFDLAALVNMLSIGVLLAYTVVAISIIVLRFSQPTNSPLPITNGANETSNLLRPGYNVTAKGFFMQLFRFKSANRPNNISMTVVCVMIACYCIVSFALALLISYKIESIIAGETWVIVTLSALSLTLLIFCLLISIQPKQVFNTRTKPFMVPIVPFLPAISVFINIYLMLMLDCYTWIRFGIWMVIGIFVYFPSTWIYNYKPIKIQTINDLEHVENINDAKIENSITDSQQESSNAPESDIASVDIINKKAQDENNSKPNEISETNSAIEILDTVLESEEDEMRNKFNDDVKMNELIQNESNVNYQPVPSPRTSLIKAESLENDDEIEIEIIVINNLEDEEALNLKLEIINPDDMIDDIRKEIGHILDEAAEKVNTQIDNENIFKNESFLAHLSDVLKSKPSPKITQTLQRVKSNEKSDSFKRSRSYHSILDVADVYRNPKKSDKVIKIEPLDITIPGTPVSSRHLKSNEKVMIKSDLSFPGMPISSKIIIDEPQKEIIQVKEILNDQEPINEGQDSIEKVLETEQEIEVPRKFQKIINEDQKPQDATEKTLELIQEVQKQEIIKEEIPQSPISPEKLSNMKKDLKKVPEEVVNKLPNFKLQSAAPEVIKSTEPPPGNKNEFKEKLARLLSNPPMNNANLRPIPKPRKTFTVQIEPEKVEEPKINEVEEKVEVIEPKAKTPFTLLTETMNRQRKLFDEVLKTIKNKSDEHANDNK